MNKYISPLIALALTLVLPSRALGQIDYFQIKGELQKGISKIETRLNQPGLKPTDKEKFAKTQKYLKSQLHDYTLIEKWQPVAERYVKEKKYEKAIEAYTRLIEGSKTGLRESLIGRANCYKLSGKPNQAIKDYERYLFNQTRFANTIPSMVQVGFMLDQNTVVKDLAALYEKNSQADKVIELYSNEIALQPQDSEAPYLKRAQCYSNLKDYDLALKDCDRVISMCSKQPTGDSSASKEHLNWRKNRAYRMRAKIYQEQKRYEKAIGDLEESLKIANKSSQVSTRLKLVELYNKAGQKEKLRLNLSSLFDFEDRHSKLTPDKIAFRKGCTLEKFSFKKEALAEFKKALQTKPDSRLYKMALKSLANPKKSRKIVETGYSLFRSDLTIISSEFLLNN